ncbi:hypothetical protein GUJ93_ZPchr0007g5384 [Zizania palustris]|uniref:Uncharacterized protein n=1 Tax=Zizania palustris TaxID=103762 RepID=A0A8J5T8H4_ZIZPA|nr:hypothetical protein GUJ93_ZPchr0007g5384 [Zizania palustris]
MGRTAPRAGWCSLAATRRRWSPAASSASARALEQILRYGVGRPSELVESKTENTEEDIPNEVKSGSLPPGFPTNEPFAFPGLRGDIEALERDILESHDFFKYLMLRKVLQKTSNRMTTRNSAARL